MIATGLIFLLGVLTATFVALLVSPLVWRKAQRLARRDFEATIPTTSNEIRAGLDRVRAEAAMITRRQEVEANEIRDRAALERAEAGRIAAQNAELRARARELEERIAQREEEFADIRSILVAREDDNARLTGALHDTQRDLDLRIEEMDALAARFRDLTDIAEERKLHIVSIETKIERVSDNLRSSERRGRELQETIDRLRGDIATLEGGVKREKAHSTSLDEKLTRLTARLADREEELSRLTRPPEADAASGETEATSPETETASGDHEAEDPDEVAVAEALRPKPGVRSQWSAPAEKPDAPAPGRPGSRSRWSTQERGAAASGPAGTTEAVLSSVAASLAGTGASDEEMRERINEIAARVIRMMAMMEGPDSPIGKLIEAQPPGNGEARADTGPTLADRVRLLMDAERAATPDASRERQPAGSAAE